MGAEAAAREHRLDLSAPPIPNANYLSAVTVGNLVYLAGHGPSERDGVRVTGKLGHDMVVDEGYETARSVAMQLLRTLKAEVEDLDRVERIVKLLCMVNCSPDFPDPPKVANGCSDLLVDIFGDAGRHARSAVGMASLPGGIAVEIEMIVQLRD
jgi:enamine deaminase RidA (YjgF/YER057c/UK114 family)